MIQAALNVVSALLFAWIGLTRQRRSNKRQAIKKLQGQVNNAKQYSPITNKQVSSKEMNFDWIKKQPQTQHPVVFLVPKSDVSKLSSQVFTRTYNSIAIEKQFDPYNWYFMREAAGGQFEIKYQQQSIIVDLRECNIDASLLKQRRIPLDPIKTNNSKYESITYSLIPNLDLIIIGTLTYSLENKKLLLIPSFLLNWKSFDIREKPNLLSKVSNYLQQQQSELNIQQAYLFLLIGSVAYLKRNTIAKFFTWIYRSCKSLLFKDRRASFQDITKVYARTEDRLKCSCGRTLNMISQCRHLSICDVCYKGGEKQCKICGMQSGDAYKVFT